MQLYFLSKNLADTIAATFSFFDTDDSIRSRKLMMIKLNNLGRESIVIDTKTIVCECMKNETIQFILQNKRTHNHVYIHKNTTSRL